MERAETGISEEDDMLLNHQQNIDSQVDEGNIKVETRKKYNKFLELLLFVGFQPTSATKQVNTLDSMLTIIEAMEMISLIIASPSNSLLRGSISGILRTTMSYSTGEAIVRMYGFGPNQIAVSTTFGIQVLIFVLLPVYLMRLTNSKDFDPSKIYNHKTSKYLGFYFRIFRPALLVPVLYSNMNVLSCSDTSDYVLQTTGLVCWQGVHLAFTFIAVISTVLMLVTVLFLQLLYKDLNPLSKDLTNGYLQLGKNFKIVCKILAVVLANWVPEIVAPICLPCVLLTMILTFCLNPRPFEAIWWGLVCWAAISSTLQQITKDSTEMYFLLCIPIVCFFTGLLASHIDVSILETKPTKEYLAIRQLLKVVHLLENHTSVTNITLLQSFVLLKNRQNPKLYKQYNLRFVSKMLGLTEQSEVPDQDEFTR